MARNKEKKVREPLNLRKEAALSPGYLLCLIWILFTIIVVLWVVVASLLRTPEIFSGNTTGYFFERLFGTGLEFENYVNAWNAQKVSVFFRNSLIYTLISCTVVIVVACPAAYVLSRFTFRGNALIQNLIATALGIPAILIIMPLFSTVTAIRTSTFMKTMGWSNSVAPFVVVFLYIAMNVPFTIFFMLAFFKNLSFTFEEAAAIDGCGPIKTFWRIMFPLAQPGVITVTIFNFITIWNEYFMSMIFAANEKYRPVAVGLYNMIQSMRYTGDWGGMFASVVIVFAPTFVLYLFLSEKIIAGVTGGAIKG